MDRQRYRQIDIYIDDRQFYGLGFRIQGLGQGLYRQIDRQRDKQIDRQLDKQIELQ